MDELARASMRCSRELEELIDELTDAERASVTPSARLAGADGLVNSACAEERGQGEVLDSTRLWVLLRGVTGDALVLLSLSSVRGRWAQRRAFVNCGGVVGHVLRELECPRRRCCH